MTIETETLREELRVLMEAPIGLLAYAAEPKVQRRVGQLLAEAQICFVGHRPER